MHYTVKQT